MKSYKIGETAYFWIPANSVQGSGDDGSSCVWDVRLAGAAADAVPIMSGSSTLLSNAAYPDGCYEISFAVTALNGFSVNNEFAVFATASISSQTPTAFGGSFVTETSGAVVAHFTNRTTNGNSTVQTLNGRYTVHVSGTFDAATTLKVMGGATGADPATFSLLRSFKAGGVRNIEFSGDIRFVLENAGGATSVSAAVQEIVT